MDFWNIVYQNRDGNGEKRSRSPFKQEQEYTEKSARLKEVNILLNMDKKENEIFDGEPDEGDMEPCQKVVGMER